MALGRRHGLLRLGHGVGDDAVRVLELLERVEEERVPVRAPALAAAERGPHQHREAQRRQRPLVPGDHDLGVHGALGARHRRRPEHAELPGLRVHLLQRLAAAHAQLAVAPQEVERGPRQVHRLSAARHRERDPAPLRVRRRCRERPREGRVALVPDHLAQPVAVQRERALVTHVRTPRSPGPRRTPPCPTPSPPSPRPPSRAPPRRQTPPTSCARPCPA